MKKTEKQTIESDVIVDIICDLCGESTKTRSNGESFSFGTLSFSGGYGSQHDTECVSLDLCESCVFTIVRLRRSGVYISVDGHLPPEEILEDTLENHLLRQAK